MILTVDIGNTTISCRLIKKQRIIWRKAISHGEFKKKGLKGFFQKKNTIALTLVVSVVPGLTQRVRRAIEQSINTPVYIIGKDVAVTIPHAYKNIKTLGTDRLVALYGSLFMYRAPFLLIDCGTAITFDIVDASETYQGGLIIPGIEASFNALKKNAAQLPQDLKLSWPRSFLAKSTCAAMNAGTLYGFTSLIEGLITRFKQEYGNDLRPIITGGSAHYIIKHMKVKPTYNPDLIHQSLSIIAQFILDR